MPDALDRKYPRAGASWAWFWVFPQDHHSVDPRSGLVRRHHLYDQTFQRAFKRAVQGGQAQAGEILLVNFENEDPIYGIDGIPFLATSYGESMKLYKASKKALDDKLAKQGMKLLYTVPWPPQGIYVNKEIGSVADMRGLKWRAYSPATAKIAELIGAQPVTIQAAELSQALATGLVNSYMSSGSTGYDSKTYESLKYWYDTQAWLPKNAVIVNKAAFDALDAPTKAALMKAEPARWQPYAPEPATVCVEPAITCMRGCNPALQVRPAASDRSHHAEYQLRAARHLASSKWQVVSSKQQVGGSRWE